MKYYCCDYWEKQEENFFYIIETNDFLTHHNQSQTILHLYIAISLPFFTSELT